VAFIVPMAVFFAVLDSVLDLVLHRMCGVSHEKSLRDLS
jgi:hypothetical protein